MSSVIRSLRSIFSSRTSAAVPASSNLKPNTTPKPTTTTTTTTTTSKPRKSSKNPKSRRPSSSEPEEFKREVARFKRLCGSENFRVQSRPYQSMVDRLAFAGKYSYIEEIIEHQKIYEETMKKETFVVRLIRLYGKAKMFEHAQKLFDEMPQLNCDRTVLSFNALLTACVNSKKYENLRVLFRELPGKLSIEPDTVSYNIVVKGLCDTDSVDSAIEVIGAMEKDGIEPDLITYNTIFHALHQEKRLADAEKIWEQMESKNIVPNVRSYNSKLRALCADKRVSEAVDLIGEMERKGVKPDSYTFNGLLYGFWGDRNLVEVKKWYGEMLKNDLLPDRVTYFMVVPFACDVGDFGFAHEVSKEMLAIKGLVSKDILQRVVDGLVKELEVDKAEELVLLVSSSNHLPFKLQLPTGKLPVIQNVPYCL